MRAASLERLAWICLAPALLWMLLWLGLPLGQTLWLALKEPGRLAALALDSRFLSSARFTLGFAALSVLLELILGLCLALALARPQPFAWLWRLCLLIPWALPAAISAKAFAWLFNFQFGLANLVLKFLGLSQSGVNWFATPAGAWLALLSLELWKTTPLVALLLLAGRLQISQAPYEAASIDGANDWDCLRHITLPLLGPLLVVAAVLRGVDALRIFDSVWVLSGGGPSGATESLSYLAYLETFQFGDAAAGARVALMMAALVAVLALLMLRLGPLAREERP